MTQPSEGGARAACPPWCRRDHGAGSHPEDLRHRGEPAIVSATIAVLDDATLRPRATTTDLVVQRLQDDATDPVWIQIAPADALGAAGPTGLLIRAGDVAALRRALAAA